MKVLLFLNIITGADMEVNIHNLSESWTKMLALILSIR